MLYEKPARQGADWRERLTGFMAETQRFAGLLDGVMPEVRWLDRAQTLSYLHGTVSTRPQPVSVPEVPCYLDALLADRALVGGVAPMMGDEHVRLLYVRGFPTRTRSEQHTS